MMSREWFIVFREFGDVWSVVVFIFIWGLKYRF